jgi:hypothetical protein
VYLNDLCHRVLKNHVIHICCNFIPSFFFLLSKKTTLFRFNSCPLLYYILKIYYYIVIHVGRIWRNWETFGFECVHFSFLSFFVENEILLFSHTLTSTDVFYIQTYIQDLQSALEIEEETLEHVQRIARRQLQRLEVEEEVLQRMLDQLATTTSDTEEPKDNPRKGLNGKKKK